MDATPQKKFFNKTFMTAGIHWLYDVLLKPRSEDEDMGRSELILNIILCSSVALSFFLETSLIYNKFVLQNTFSGVSTIEFATIFIFFSALLIISRKGYYLFSIHAVIIVYFIAVTFTELTWGVSTPAGLLGYAMIIVMSSVLLGRKFTLKISFLIVVILLILAYRESLIGAVPEWKKQPVNFDNGLQYSIIILAMTLLAWLASREIDKSLHRARSSEKILKEERDQLEITVQQRTDELKKVQAEKVSQLYRFAEFGKLSSGIFHDLINPLSTVAANMDSLGENLHSEIKGVKDHLDLAVKASSKMNNFISAVRKQIQTDEFKELFSVNASIEEVLLLFHYKATKEHIFLQFEAKERIQLFGNPVKFHQVIANLVSNAIDSYDDITMKDSMEKSVTVFLTTDNENIEIKVEDHGHGIKKEAADHIFDPFFTTKSSDKGIGLGLSTTKEIIQKEFDGTITFSSTGTDDTTFIITLPCTSYEKNTGP